MSIPKVLVLSDKIIDLVISKAANCECLLNPPKKIVQSGCGCGGQPKKQTEVTDYNSVRTCVVNNQTCVDEIKAALGVDQLVIFINDAENKLVRKVI